MSNNEIQFAPLIIGTMRLGVWGEKMDTPQLERFIDECLELGLNDFDHADIYGHYTTEGEFGKVLQNRPDLRDKIQITTKCGIKLTTPNRPEHKIASYDSTPAHIIKSVDQSLAYLATDHIDLLLLHRPDFLLDPAAVAECIEKLKADGKILHFGVSNYSASQFELLNSFTPLVTNQIEVSLMHREALEDGTLDQCINYDITPTAWSPLGAGMLWAKEPTDEVTRILKVATDLQEKYNCELDQLMLAWILKHPSGIIPVLGTSKIARIKAAQKALDIELSHEDWYILFEAARGYEVA